MAQVVTKFRYLKAGQGKQAAKYLKYIATRDGVVKIDDTFKLKPATKNQREFIATIIKDFPDCKEMHEYADYLENKTVGNASEFITRALEDNAFEMVDSKTYADYIATRPRVQKFGTHGLFSDSDEPIELEQISLELLSYKGNVWTVIISLRREDAVEYGYDHGERWRDMLRGQTEKLSSALHIPMTDLKWYAAFHDESYHPHVHLIAYAEHSKNGYLDDKGINSLRSAYANAIFDRKLIIKLYQEQTVERDKLRSVSREIIGDKSFVFSQVAPFQPVAVRPTTAIENERAKELSKLCRTIGPVVKTNPSSNKNNEIIRLCKCINAIADNIYKEALSKIPISEIFAISMKIRNGAIPINEVVKMMNCIYSNYRPECDVEKSSDYNGRT